MNETATICDNSGQMTRQNIKTKLALVSYTDYRFYLTRLISLSDLLSETFIVSPPRPPICLRGRFAAIHGLNCAISPRPHIFGSGSVYHISTGRIRSLPSFYYWCCPRMIMVYIPFQNSVLRICAPFTISSISVAKKSQSLLPPLDRIYT